MNLKRTIDKIRASNPRIRISAFEFHDHIWLFNIEVEDDFQNFGIGSDAIEALKKIGKPIACIPMSLTGRQKDLERFYTKLGFEWEQNKKQMVWRKSDGTN